MLRWPAAEPYNLSSVAWHATVWLHAPSATLGALSDWKEDLLDAAKERWHTKTGLLAAVAVVVFSLIVTFAGLSLEEVSPREIAAIAIACTVVVVAWLKTRLPRVPRGKVGFGIAIDCQGDAHSKQLCSDFTVALRDSLTGSKFRHEFVFIELSPSIAAQLTDAERASSVARRANLSFLLYGRARLRTMVGGPAYVIDLHGVIRHSAVNRVFSKEIGQGIRESLPTRVVLPSDQSFLACEFAAKHIDVVAKYIIGTAAALSNDFSYAEQLFRDAEGRLKNHVQEAEGAPLTVLLERVQTALRELYQEWLSRLIRLHTWKRDVDTLREAEPLIPKLREYDRNNYAAHLVTAMCAFVLRRDMRTARRELDACRRVKDATWRYSVAFLEAYDGNLDAAYRSYSKAFTAPLADPTVPTQSEEFIQTVLDAEPDRPWLFFCLGIINLRAKGDFRAAATDFRQFLDRVDRSRFPAQVENVQKWLNSIPALDE